MFRKLSIVFSAILLFSLANSAQAALIINEIMYDLSGSDSANSKSREWVEVYNNGSSAVDVDAEAWRIYDGAVNRTINGEVDFSVPAGAYVIFAGDKDTFLADNPGFSGAVYDTGITSLNNTGATLKLLDQDGNTADQVAYASSQGATGDGNTLQKISGNLTAATPTPGATNESSGGGSGSGGTPSQSAGGTSQPVKPPEKIRIEISARPLAFTGEQIIFEASAFGTSGERLSSGKYFWNFGDGSSRESNLSYSQEKFTHSYFYPGEYSVVLEFYMNTYAQNPDATQKVAVKIVSADVVISKVGDEKDFFVEISNNSDNEADLSLWRLNSGEKNFVFPKNTALAPEKSLRLSPQVTNFSLEDKIGLKLFNSQSELAFDYAASIAPVKKFTSAVKAPSTFIPAPNLPTPEQGEPLLEEITRLDLAAAPISGSGEELKEKNSYLPIIAFSAFLPITAGVVYFLRRYSGAKLPGDDFELIDE